MATKPKRGRRPGPKTQRFQALLYPEQIERLYFLKDQLPGSPPITGLVREAVEAYLEKMYTDRVEDAFKEARQEGIRILK